MAIAKAMQILMIEMMITWKSMVSVELSRLVLHSILSRASACASSPSASATAGLSCLDNKMRISMAKAMMMKK